MHEPYKIEDIINSVQTSYLSMNSAMALCSYHNRNKTLINESLTDIELASYLISKEVQRFSLDESSLERFVISSSMRGVVSAMYEGLKNNNEFKLRIEAIILDQYYDFFALINLLRNLYSHEITWMKTSVLLEVVLVYSMAVVMVITNKRFSLSYVK